ncbi:cyclin-dependent protein kinase [Encephalitozoon intestinalis ATCC 50506]|uniref:Cyclin-dependent protein kinase n=1 Tax=Encephalitozoon intestinalis (strain ATCC 50506) TaxID=876142 RepID=E0S9Z5_ENCIT|nr:cyclin-dependent protein kinase [Encephalitozoon intestinalis ATCC 50506]ADM12617.1 cyclin-dependent protein kinase [Encephalitozoon intestinalis ATCC 50506]UTX46476.1 putative mitogen-activated protein kinase [Encephalitozoon intestinalis]
MLLKGGRKCDSIEKYEKLCRISSGSFGNVYRVRRKTDKKEFALKRMNPSMCHDTNGFSILYMREVMILKHARNKNVMGIEEVVEGCEINDFFIVMECCDIDLKSIVLKTGGIGMEVAKFFTYQILQGLEFLHGIGVVHRDLKPSNILLMRSGDLKIADFGLARAVGSTMTNLVVTLWYRAIEVLLGSETYNESIDMWSVGCIVGEMLKGGPILPGEGEIDQLDRIFKLLGYPADEDFAGLCLPHLKNIRRPGSFEASFGQDFGCYGQEVVDFVGNLLSFDPRKRHSASQSLSSLFVANGRDCPRELIKDMMDLCIRTPNT